jgi:polysaccharide biosynthesis/export protein
MTIFTSTKQINNFQRQIFRLSQFGLFCVLVGMATSQTSFAQSDVDSEVQNDFTVQTSEAQTEVQTMMLSGVTPMIVPEKIVPEPLTSESVQEKTNSSQRGDANSADAHIIANANNTFYSDPAYSDPAGATYGGVAESAYTLGPGDVVEVSIFRVSQYSGSSEVLVDGTLNLPLIGRVNVNGLTLEAAAAVLSERYGQYLRRPLVTLSLANRRPLRIGIAGEVSRPGSYTVAQEGTQTPRLSQLLETAGGVTQSADLRQVQIRRPQANGQVDVFAVDLWDLVETGNLSQDITLRDGDSVYIPTAMVPLQDASLMANASFSADSRRSINIAIIGEVYRPGPYTVQGGVARTGEAGVPGNASASSSPTTVTRAIQVAGGIKPQADIRSVQVVRPTRSGTPQIFEVDLWRLLETGDLQQDAILQEGDTVFIPTATAIDASEVNAVASASFSPNAIRINVIGEVERPGGVDLPPNSPLTQAILASGGFNNRANRGEAELIRLNPDGTVTRRTITVDFAQALSEENNPLLRNDDVVIVNPSSISRVSDQVGSVLDPIGSILTNLLFPIRFLNIFR